MTAYVPPPKPLHFQVRASVTLPPQVAAGSTLHELRKWAADRLARRLAGDTEFGEIPLEVTYEVYPETDLAWQLRRAAREEYEPSNDGDLEIDDDAGVSLVREADQPDYRGWVQAWVYVVLAAPRDYADGLCPGCRAPLPADYAVGDVCSVCGHVFRYLPTKGDADGPERQ